jgi:hypothetical protein
MPQTRPGDVVRARVEKIAMVDGRCVATLRRRHADFKAERAQSFCDVVVALPGPAAAAAGADASALREGDEVEVVLSARAEAARVADLPGNYSCRLHAAKEIPAIPIERSTERIWAGLVERTDPPASGDVVLHLGSGLTCYVELAGEGPFPPEAIEHGTFAEFILEEPLRALLLRKVAPKR